MSESVGPLRLKHPSGFFATGSEVRDAIGLLSDGGFKLFVYVCLHADRRTAQLRFRMAELAKAVGHSTRSLTTYLDELDRAGVGAVYRASNQHELGRVEILDRFWPYYKESGDSTADPEQAHYVARVRDWYLEQACVTSAFGAADEKLAADWYRSGISLDVVGRAFLLGCARKYVALFNNQGGTPVTSLHYFSGIVQETAAMELNLNYWRYLSARVKKMDAQWRAQANFARAAGAKTAETK
jgi:hypothetical protein